MITYVNEHSESHCLCGSFYVDHIDYDVFFTGEEFIVFAYNKCILNGETRSTFFMDRIQHNIGVEDCIYKYDIRNDLKSQLKEFRLRQEKMQDKFMLVYYYDSLHNHRDKILYKSVNIAEYIKINSTIKDSFKKTIEEINKDEILCSVNYRRKKEELIHRLEHLFFMNYSYVDDREVHKSIDSLIKLITKKIK